MTGAFGCIGAWTVATLVREGVAVTAFDLGTDNTRLRLIATPDEIERVAVARGDIAHLTTVERALAKHRITHIVHLAALQVPFCKADPVLGAQVNVTGTVNVFEAAKRHGLETTIAYASSAAVYDEKGTIGPRTLYGVYKVANEGTAAIYAADVGLASVGLRPFTVYGPGRDQGLTADPTHAMVAAAHGEPYRIGFGGRTQLHYAPDVARAFVRAARSDAHGAAVYNLGGPATAIADLVELIRGEVPSAEISVDDVPLPFPPELPEPWFDTPLTPVEQGVRETIAAARSVV